METLLSPANKELGIDALIAIIKIAVIFNALLGLFSLMTYIERRVLGFMQFRRGPNRTGPWGILQPAADGIKLFFKEELMPEGANKFLFFAAPIVALITAYVSLAVVPYGGPLVLPFYGQVSLFGRPINLQMADLDVGILFIFAMSSLEVYGVIMGGWASNSKYPFLAALRSASQII